MRNGNLVLNGGFETGDFTDWTVAQSGIFPQTVTGIASPSVYAAYMSDGDGGLFQGGGSGTASISQNMYMHYSAKTPILRVGYRIDGQDNDGEGYDYIEVLINDSRLVGAYWWSDTGGWQVFEYDLSEYMGETITLEISAFADDSMYIANYYVDDISITFE